MGTKAKWIASILIGLTIIGLIALWESNKPEQPNLVGYFGSTPQEMKGKSFNSIDEAVDEFAKTYTEEAKVSKYDVYYKATTKYQKQHQIPGVIVFNMPVDNEKHEVLHIAPFYINEKDNHYSVAAYSISVSTDRIKESPKYVIYTQPLKNNNYDFIFSKHKLYLPESDVVINMKKHKLFMGILNYDNSYIEI
ncbi:hypothetical protein BFS35_000030 [Macrococcoides goetzii]|uniref:Uncharacterized protein n=1 Tax=Macrococcoides goetzii TaxID=1891097 RepID=A0A2G5NNQ7_9STAP|nr:hypothetical protein [Macrococcus goetzii]RAI82108.1 hypothetical protein BFS35_000030 [Macrococcus goetzii]